MKRSLPEKPLEHLFPPKKRIKHTKPECEKTIFQGTVVKKLNWKKLCFVMPDEGQEAKAESLGIKSKGVNNFTFSNISFVKPTLTSLVDSLNTDENVSNENFQFSQMQMCTFTSFF